MAASERNGGSVSIISSKLIKHHYRHGSTIQIPKFDLSLSPENQLVLDKLTFALYTREANLFIINRLARDENEDDGVERLAILRFPRNISEHQLSRALLQSIYINSEEYTFLCSSAARARCYTPTCYIWRGDRGDRAAMLEQIGEFYAIRPASKQLARLELLFTTLRHVCPISWRNVCMEVDISVSNPNGGLYLFTDGCGRIGVQLAQRIAQQTKYLRFLHAS